MHALHALSLCPVSALAGPDLVRVDPDASLAAVCRALADADVGALVAGDVGVVSERDVVRALATGRDPSTTTAAEVASTHIVSCGVAATVVEAAAAMLEQGVRHLLGIVSARDLLSAYASAALSGDLD